MRNIQTKVAEKKSPHFIFNYFLPENRAVY